jgi:hypothetical protein
VIDVRGDIDRLIARGVAPATAEETVWRNIRRAFAGVIDQDVLDSREDWGHVPKLTKVAEHAG